MALNRADFAESATYLLVGRKGADGQKEGQETRREENKPRRVHPAAGPRLRTVSQGHMMRLKLKTGEERDFHNTTSVRSFSPWQTQHKIGELQLRL